MAIRTFRLTAAKTQTQLPTVAQLEAALLGQLPPQSQLLRWAIVATDATHWHVEGAALHSTTPSMSLA